MKSLSALARHHRIDGQPQLVGAGATAGRVVDVYPDVSPRCCLLLPKEVEVAMDREEVVLAPQKGGIITVWPLRMDSAEEQAKWWTPPACPS